MTTNNTPEDKQLKKPNVKTNFGGNKLQELSLCMDDPIYFIENFVKIQNPILGSVSFQLYDYQKEIINLFRTNRFSIVLTARQLGKCLSFDTIITKNGEKQTIGSLMKLSFKQRIVSWLERILLKLAMK